MKTKKLVSVFTAFLMLLTLPVMPANAEYNSFPDDPNDNGIIDMLDVHTPITAAANTNIITKISQPNEYDLDDETGSWFYTGLPSLYYGDINRNCKNDISDLTMLKKHITKEYALSESEFEIADMNGDGVIDVFDFMLLKRQILQTSAHEEENTRKNASDSDYYEIYQGDTIIFTPDYLVPGKYFGIACQSDGRLALKPSTTTGAETAYVSCTIFNEAFLIKARNEGTVKLYFYQDIQNPDDEVTSSDAVIALGHDLSEIQGTIVNEITISVKKDPIKLPPFTPPTTTTTTASKPWLTPTTTTTTVYTPTYPGLEEKTCIYCNGKGSKNCSTCSGLGYYWVGSTRKICNGCNGLGKKTCNFCGGKGTQ